MKARITLFILIVSTFFGTAFAVELPYIKFNDKKVSLHTGDSLILKVNYKNYSGDSIVNNFNFAVLPESLGIIKDNVFFAINPGKGKIVADFNKLTDTMFIYISPKVNDSTDKVKPDIKKDSIPKTRKDSLPEISLRIIPADTTVVVGSSVTYIAQQLNSSNTWVNTSVSWKLEGDKIGNFDKNGVLTINQRGVAYVIARSEGAKAISKIIATKPITDSLGLNSISVYRHHKNGKAVPPVIIYEGEAYNVEGLPAPMNLLNGGQIYFPVGSLHEDISIQIELPSFAKTDTISDVKFGNRIANAASFHVLVNDVKVEPYYFDIPLDVTIPYKNETIKKLGFIVSKLSLFFATDSTNLDSDGIYNIQIDSAANKIYGKVAHFSNLAVAETNGITSIKQVKENILNIYPNPFSDKLYVNVTGENEVYTVSLINLIGQTLITKKLTSDDQIIPTENIKAGVYFVRVSGNGEILGVKKMVKR